MNNVHKLRTEKCLPKKILLKYPYDGSLNAVHKTAESQL